MARHTQGHPVFAEPLRPMVESHYRLDTNVPVGDAPRVADFVLLRRTRAGLVPGAGPWRDPRPWNVLEFTGPTVSPRHGDLARLVELGLGIARRLNKERVRQGRHRGVRRVIEELGGVKKLWAELTPEERRQLKRLMQD